MLGSTFISEADPDRLHALAEDVDGLHEFDHVSLDVLCTLDFETALAESGNQWMTGKPPVYDAESGLVIAKICPASLTIILGEENAFDDEQSVDLEALRGFIRAHGDRNIYELATF